MRLLVIFLLLLSSAATAQRMRLLSGSTRAMRALNGQESYNIRFDYDSITVGIDTPEEVYLEKKRADWNSREPGKGDDFVKKWFDSRAKYYEPLFIATFERYANVKLKDSTAAYTMIIKTRNVEAGWNIGLADHPGEIAGEFWIVESADEH